MIIRSMESLEEAAVRYGILPFFPNNIRGFSVQEMCAPGLLFGGNDSEGCWEWKGPVVRNRTTAYGKFFRRKAGFVNLELLPFFLSFRKALYPVQSDSVDEMIYDIISMNDKMTSTELRELLTGKPKKRTAFDLPDPDSDITYDFSGFSKRHSFEGPLQRLQMGGFICISDFKYKVTKKGERYGWGVAEYSTPETLFGRKDLEIDLSPEECREYIIEYTKKRYPSAHHSQLLTLIS